ncbi:hypothetical protein LshimejAT787_0202740 [Lyophyllum shimeji]|uniref:Uncharacterized protein n=1 Tax=Lyophyllum shimeji TaxID=47721 RepID=A0A9P3PFX0_LYOSH|nr:hypothetical protein LshimejAT787_0202740 [Lyophyllum shimeji]
MLLDNLLVVSAPSRTETAHSSFPLTKRNDPCCHVQLQILAPMSVKMLGYLINDDELVKYGVELGLGTAESENARENTIVDVATHLFARGGLFGHGRFVGVMVNGKPRSCFAVACNDPDERFPPPSRAALDRFKKVLGTEKEPRWYTYA